MSLLYRQPKAEITLTAAVELILPYLQICLNDAIVEIAPGVPVLCADGEQVRDAVDVVLHLREGEEGHQVPRVGRHRHHDEEPPETHHKATAVSLGHHCATWEARED